MIPPDTFAPFIKARFERTGKHIDDAALEGLLDVTHGHPYGTQELAYFAWELVRPGKTVTMAELEEALERVLRSEHNHFVQLWDDAPHPQRRLMLALAEEPTRRVYSSDYQSRHDLPATPTLQTALAGLVHKEIVGRNEAGEYYLIEPFLAEWLHREQEGTPRKPGRYELRS